MAAIPVRPNDLGRGPMIMGVSWLFTLLCTSIVALRFYVRAKIHHAISSDDWFMLSAMACQIVFQVFTTEGFLSGLGKHAADLTPVEIIQSTKWKWLSVTPSIAVGVLARISIAILLGRLFCSAGGKVWFRWYLIGFSIVQTIAGVLAMIIMYVQVSPVRGLWEVSLPARRWNKNIHADFIYVLQALFCFSDVSFVLFPIIIIWRLNMSVRRKLGLGALLGLSLVTMAATIEKTIVTTQAGLKSTTSGYDVPYEASLATLWSAVDQSLVIALGCVPPLYGFVAPFVNGLASYVSSSLSSSKLSRRSRKAYQRSGSSEEIRGTSTTGPDTDIKLAYMPNHSSEGDSKTPRVLGPGAAMEEELLRETIVDRSRADESPRVSDGSAVRNTTL
ncbi:hypothetical protein ABKA04_004095 [Annulohypoxylon sp. FPYF3050]